VTYYHILFGQFFPVFIFQESVR